MADEAEAMDVEVQEEEIDKKKARLSFGPRLVYTALTFLQLQTKQH